MKYKIGYEFWLRSELRHVKARIEAYVTIDRQNGTTPQTHYLVWYRDEQGTPHEIIRNEQWISEKMKA